MPTVNNNAFIPVTTLRQGLINTSTPPDLNKGILALPSNSGTTTYPADEQRKYIQSWNLIVEREGKSVPSWMSLVSRKALLLWRFDLQF